MALLSKLFKTVAVVLTVTMVSCKKSINMKALVLTTEGTETDAIELNFNSYGIPYDMIEFTSSDPFTGNLSLYDEDNDPKYNLIVINGGYLLYDLNGDWVSALDEKQWELLNDYEAKNNVRRIVISDDVSTREDCTIEDESHWGDTKEDQPLIADKSDEIQKIFNDAGVKINAPLNVDNIYHLRVKILNSSTTKPLFYYSDNGKKGAVAATVSKYNDGREVMSFFFGFGSWHQSSVIVNHIWLTWGFRNLYNGFRRVYFTPHIDDVFLSTELVDVAHNKEYSKYSEEFRTSPLDYQKIAQFQKDILKDMPEGSFYRVELAFNGNGMLINVDYDLALEIDGERYVDIEYVKEPGTGDKRWPKENYEFSKTQLNAFKKDDLFKYFANNSTAQKEFFWSSHTFSHENLDNASKSDVDNEIRLNIQVAEMLGLTDKEWWSGHAIITPQISGIHNKDALEIFEKYGITSATGDLSREALCNHENPYLPFYTTEESSNYPGFAVIPRTPTEIYYFCSSREEDAWMFNKMYYKSYYSYKLSWDEIAESEARRTLLLMLKLRHEAHQFHQANLRYYKKGKGLGNSLLEDWTRAVVNEYTKYVDWPLISIKISKQADIYTDRADLEACGHQTKLIAENDKIVGVSVSASKGNCIVPVTVPTTVKKSSLPSGATLEQVGKDPLTVWVPVKKGETKTFKFEKAIDWKVSGSEADVANTDDEPTPEQTKYKCMAETVGYSCCPSKYSTVYYTDSNGEWGYNVDIDDWCGITPYSETDNEEKCWAEDLGYNCCKFTCTVYDTDENGNWGVEDNEWCAIPSKCN